MQRQVNITHKDLLVLLQNQDPYVGMFEEEAQKILMGYGTKSIIIICFNIRSDIGACVVVVEDASSPCKGYSLFNRPSHLSFIHLSLFLGWRFQLGGVRLRFTY